MAVSKNGGTPKWMVKIMENPIKIWMILGGKPTIFGNTHILCCLCFFFEVFHALNAESLAAT